MKLKLFWTEQNSKVEYTEMGEGNVNVPRWSPLYYSILPALSFYTPRFIILYSNARQLHSSNQELGSLILDIPNCLEMKSLHFFVQEHSKCGSC